MQLSVRILLQNKNNINNPSRDSKVERAIVSAVENSSENWRNLLTYLKKASIYQIGHCPAWKAGKGVRLSLALMSKGPQVFWCLRQSQPDCWNDCGVIALKLSQNDLKCLCPFDKMVLSCKCLYQATNLPYPGTIKYWIYLASCTELNGVPPNFISTWSLWRWSYVKIGSLLK